jgi:hypothetical protein
MSTPTSASNVFSVNKTGTGDSPANSWPIGFEVDMNINTQTSGNSGFVMTRLLGGKYPKTNDSGAVNNASGQRFWDSPTGQWNLNTNWWTTSSNVISWSWARARGYFDVVTYTGTGSARTLTHNLGAAPEMMWVKCRSEAQDWAVYHNNIDSSSPEDYGIYLNDTASRVDSANFWNDTAPTSSVFTVGTAGKTNGSSKTYIAYLFATAADVSKVGSYTGNSNTQNIDCGFSSGARFLIIKRTDSSGNWYVWDSVRGIGASSDPYLYLNANTAEQGSDDYISANSSGFTINSGGSPINENSASYIFYAIA